MYFIGSYKAQNYENNAENATPHIFFHTLRLII